MREPWVARLVWTERNTIELRAPTVAYWGQGPQPGGVLVPGGSLGLLEVLGRVGALHAPREAGGLVVGRLSPDALWTPAEYGAVLVELDPRAGGAELSRVDHAPGGALAEAALVYRAPMSGRVYHRQSPEQPPFVTPGDVIESGQTVCLLEVMKTFNRVVYGGPGLPERARVVRVLVDDGADVAGQDPLFELERPGV